MDSANNSAPTRTAAEAGWHESRYNLRAPAPDGGGTLIANLRHGDCACYGPLETYLLAELDTLPEDHPILKLFIERGLIVNYDEKAAIDAEDRIGCASPRTVFLTICPTFACDFACPYCLEKRRGGKMSSKVQDDVIDLARRMLDASGVNDIRVTWFGGEPLLAPDVMESLSRRLMALCEERGGTYSALVLTNGYRLTQDVVDMFAATNLVFAQVTIDGMGDVHDATRPLVGGGPTFERIVANLRENHIPFRVNIRHNVHSANSDEVEKLRAFVGQLAEESGNDLHYYPTPVIGNEGPDELGKPVEVLSGAEAVRVGIERDLDRFSPGRVQYCDAQSLWALAIDEKGNLHKCPALFDDPLQCFGTAGTWDPARPFTTASNPSTLTSFLNLSPFATDDECRDCVWYPVCQGGCPYNRLYTERRCVAYKDDPEAYVRALFERSSRTANAAVSKPQEVF